MIVYSNQTEDMPSRSHRVKLVAQQVRPEPRGIIERTRLSFSAGKQWQILVLSGPAGSGKTVFLKQWVASHAPDNCIVQWIDLASHSVDIEEQIRLLSESAYVETQGARAGEDTLATADPGAETIVVLDNYETVTDRAIDDAIVSLVSSYPRIRFAIATRSTKAFARLAHSAVAEIQLVSAKMLAFTLAESTELMVNSDRAEILPPLHTNGRLLASAARLASAAIQRDQYPWDDSSAEWVREISKATLEANFDINGNSQLLETLTYAAIPESLSERLAAVVAPQFTFAELGDLVERLGIGAVETAPSGVEAVVFEPIYRIALRNMATVPNGPRLETLRRKIVQDALEQKNWLVAMQQTALLEDFYFLSRIIREFWSLLVTDQFRTIAPILASIDDRVIRTFPTLAISYALYLNSTGRHTLANFYSTHALRASVNKDVDFDASERSWDLTIQSIAHRLLANFGKSATKALAANELISRLPPGKEYPGITELLTQQGISMLYAKGGETSLNVWENAYKNANDSRSAAWFHAAALSAGVHAVNGNMVAATRLIRAIDESRPPREWENSYIGYFLKIARAVDAIEGADLASAQRHLNAVQPQVEYTEHWPFLAIVQAWIHMSAGRAGDALEGVEEALRSCARTPISGRMTGQLSQLRAWILLSLHHFVAADAVIGSLPRNDSGTRTLRALRFLIGGNVEQAWTHIGAVMYAGPRGDDVRLDIARQLVIAGAATRLGKRDSAKTAAESAMARTREFSSYTPWLLLPRTDFDAVCDLLSPESRELATRHRDSREVTDDLFSPTMGFVHLSKRELLVLEELTHSTSISQIAAALSVSTNTVKSQTRTLYRKLGVHSRKEALIRAAEVGLA